MNLKYPTKDHQKEIDQMITSILLNTQTKSDSVRLSVIIDEYATDGVILGCTELSILHQKDQLNVSTQVFDTIYALAKVCIENTEERVKF